MSEATDLLGTAAPGRTLTHNGKTFTFVPALSNEALTALEANLYDRARAALEALRTSYPEAAYLDRLDAIYGPGAGRPDKPVVFVLDNGPIHTSKASRAALAARDWLTIEWLPKYAPELNDIERSWRDLKRHFLAHQTFTDIDHLDRTIHQAITDMNRERQSPLCTNLRIAA